MGADMKYLVNRETKEHVVYRGIVPSENWDIVEADEDGWIINHYDTNPLPSGARLDVRYVSGQKIEGAWPADMVRWSDVKLYRPILDKPDKEFLEACNNSAGAKYAESFNAAVDRVLERAIEEAAAAEGRLSTLLERLRAAHEAAQRIPDIEAELRDVLGAMGYDLVARSPFVERTQ
jgi:hypothetical protein